VITNYTVQHEDQQEIQAIDGDVLYSFLKVEDNTHLFWTRAGH